MKSLLLILSNKRYFAPCWVFTSINLLMGTWVLYIPSIKEKLNLNDAELGIALFYFALGIICILPFVPYITKKLGTGKYTLIGITLFACSFILPFLAPTFVLLCISLFIVGIFSGSTDVAMNALVSEIEKTDKTNFMSAAHGFFSLGGVLGAGIGSLLIGIYTPTLAHVFLMIGLVITSNILLSKNYYTINEIGKNNKSNSSKIGLFKPLIGLAVIAFGIMASEGAIEHWSNLYLLEIVGVTNHSIAGIGFVLFSTSMTIGRFFGDKISEQIGSLKVIIYGCILAAFGFGLVLTTKMLLSIIGFAIIGLGLSVVIPELFRAAGNVKNISAAVGISFVSGVGFIGFLLGPVVLGFISNSSNLRMSFVALLSVILLSICIAMLNLKFISKNR